MAAPGATQQAEPPRRRPASSYVVQAGDVASVIAERTGVSLQVVEALNPGVDVRAIRPGQKLKLAP